MLEYSPTNLWIKYSTSSIKFTDITTIIDNFNIFNFGYIKITSDVSSMSGMFKDSSFNGSLNTYDGRWDVSSVTNMSSMFNNATEFNKDISNWNVSNVTNMSSMFSGASSFNQDISNWTVSNVTDMSAMFQNCISFNQNISNWDVSNVTTMSNMFNDATTFNQDISSWNVKLDTNINNMFNNSGIIIDSNKTNNHNIWFNWLINCINESIENKKYKSSIYSNLLNSKLTDPNYPLTNSEFLSEFLDSNHIENWTKINDLDISLGGIYYIESNSISVDFGSTNPLISSQDTTLIFANKSNKTRSIIFDIYQNKRFIGTIYINTIDCTYHISYNDTLFVNNSKLLIQGINNTINFLKNDSNPIYFLNTDIYIIIKIINLF